MRSGKRTAMVTVALLLAVPPAQAEDGTRAACDAASAALQHAKAQDEKGTALALRAVTDAGPTVEDAEIRRLSAELLVDLQGSSATAVDETVNTLLRACRRWRDDNPEAWLGPIGWWWNSLYVGLFDRNKLLMYLFGWELFLVPIFVVLSIVVGFTGVLMPRRTGHE